MEEKNSFWKNFKKGLFEVLKDTEGDIAKAFGCVFGLFLIIGIIVIIIVLLIKFLIMII